MKKYIQNSILCLILICSSNLFALSGNYTIGQGGNYANFNIAMQALRTQGITSSVVFNILPGFYNEQIIVPKVTGVSSTKSVTFQSANGDSTSVILSYNASRILRLDTAAYINIHKISLLNSVNNGMDMILFVGNSTNIKITNCVFSSTGYSGSFILIGSYSANYEVVNNSFTGRCDYGVSFYGATLNGNYSSNLKICNNCFLVNEKAIYINSFSNIQILNNNIMNGYLECVYLRGGTNTIINNIIIGKLRYCNNYGSNCNTLIANNFIKHPLLVTNIVSSLPCDVYIFDSKNLKFCNNTIYGKSNLTDPVTLLKANVNLTFKNNIVVDTGSGVICQILNDTNLLMNYNNYYSKIGAGLWQIDNQTPLVGLGSWKLASGQDTNSFNINPMFVTEFDLHITNPILNNSGTPLSFVLTDIDGELRPAIPDIGADESLFSVIDITPIAFRHGTDGSCSPTNDSLFIKLKNVGLNSINFNTDTLKLSLNVTGAVTNIYNFVLISGSLLKDSTIEILITNSFNFSISGTYLLNLNARISSDSNLLNDQISNSLTNYKISSFPSLQNFEACTPSSEIYNTLGTLTQGWTVGGAINAEFRVKQGPYTYPYNTGPNSDHTTGNGNYTVSRPGGSFSDAKSFLISPCIDLGFVQNPKLTFWYHYYGNIDNSSQTYVDTLLVDIFDGTNWINGVWSIIGQQQASPLYPWLSAMVDLNPYLGQIIKVRFRVEYEYPMNYGAIGIDDVSFSGLPNIQLVNDTGFCLGNSLSLNVPGMTGYQCKWTKIGSTSTLSTTSSINITTAGSYIFTITNSLGANISDTVNVIQFQQPIVSLGSDTIICATQKLTLFPGSNFVSYLWQNGSPNVVFIVDSTNGPGTFWVKVKNQFGCFNSDTISVVIDSCVVIQHANIEQFSFQIYPNPNNGRFWIKPSQDIGESEINLISDLGINIKTEKLYLKKDETINLNFESLSEGIYLLCIKSDIGIFTARLIIH